MQLSLALRTPDEHGEGLHPSPRHGVVLVWQKLAPQRRWQKIEPTDPMARLLAGQAGGRDRFISVNEFAAWRLVRHLRSLRAVWADLDACHSVEHALMACEDALLPQPSYAVLSGRGVHLYWLLEATPGAALPVWQAVQQRVIQGLATVGADPACADCTRVLRLVGSINDKTGTEVLGYVISGARWTLHELADEVLGPRKLKPASVTSVEVARAKRAVAQAAGTFQLWHSRYLDLCLIADHHAFMRGIPEGYRDRMLFLLANALSWFTRSETLGEEIERVGRMYTPGLRVAEIRQYTQPILKRAVMAAEGKRIEWQGDLVDPRYRFRTETLRDWLGDLLVPQLEGKLRVLLPRAALDERERERQKARNRVKEGRYERLRTEYLTQFEDSQNAQRPWEALGISRATYFRRKSSGE